MLRRLTTTTATTLTTNKVVVSASIGRSFHSNVVVCGKKKARFAPSGRPKKVSQKRQNIVRLEYDPHKDLPPRKQEFIQSLQEQQRAKVHKMIVEFDQATISARVVHTALMSETLRALKQFSNEQQNNVENKSENVSKLSASHLDSFKHLFSSQSLIDDERFLLALQGTLAKAGFLEVNTDSIEILDQTRRYAQAFIDPTYLIAASKDVSQKAIKHFSNIEFKAFGISLVDSLIRDYITRYSMVEKQKGKTGITLLEQVSESDTTNNELVTVSSVVPALTDLPRYPVTKQELVSIEKALKNLSTLQHVLESLELTQFIQYVPFAQVHDPDQFHGISKEEGDAQLQLLANANSFRAILAVYYMHNGMEKTVNLFNEVIVPIAVSTVQEKQKEQDFVHYPNALKELLLNEVKYEPEYRYINVRRELEGTMGVHFSKQRSRALLDIEMMNEHRKATVQEQKLAGKDMPEDAIDFSNKYKLVGVELYVNGQMVATAISDSFTQAKHKVARLVYEDITTNPLQMKKLRDKLINKEYIQSLLKVSKISRAELSRNQ